MAVFIDIENINPVAIPPLFDRIVLTWDPFIRRAYGSCLPERHKILLENGVMPVEVIRNAPGKNSSDHALINDAMRELSQGCADAFGIVSGDGDFAKLALKIRERGKQILVFGPKNTALALRRSCTEFCNLVGNRKRKKKRRAKLQAQHTPCPDGSIMPVDDLLREALCRLFKEHAGESGRTTVEVFSKLVNQQKPFVSPKRYGARSMTSLLKKLGVFELRQIRNSLGVVTNYEVILRHAQPAVESEHSRPQGIVRG